MGKLKTTRVRSNTIIETIVALTILSIVFGIATTFFVRLTKGTDSLQKIKAKSILRLYADRTVANKEFFDATEQVNGLLVMREIGDTTGAGNLIRIHFSVMDSSQVLLSEWNQLITNDH